MRMSLNDGEWVLCDAGKGLCLVLILSFCEVLVSGPPSSHLVSGCDEMGVCDIINAISLVRNQIYRALAFLVVKKKLVAFFVFVLFFLLLLSFAQSAPISVRCCQSM